MIPKANATRVSFNDMVDLTTSGFQYSEIGFYQTIKWVSQHIVHNIYISVWTCRDRLLNKFKGRLRNMFAEIIPKANTTPFFTSLDRRFSF